MSNEKSLQLEKLRLLEQQKELEEGLPHLYGFPFYKWGRKFFESRNPITLLCAGNQLSKALPLDTDIPTPEGWRKMADLKIGDYVFGRDGKPTKIVGIPFEGSDLCYEIKFDDQTSIVASRHHEWFCKLDKQRFKKRYSLNRPNPEYNQWIVQNTEEIIQAGKYAPAAPTPKRRASIPLTDGVDYPMIDLFDPYLLGYLIGNGSFHGSVMVSVNKADLDIISYLVSNYGAYQQTDNDFRINGMVPTIKGLGLWGHRSYEKFIPKEYLSGSKEQRLSLLAGLMDSDGTITKGRIMSYTTTSSRLKDDFIELVTSLGGMCTDIKEHSAGYKKEGRFVPCRNAFTIRIETPFNPFRIKRKASRYYQISHRSERIIYTIDPLGQMLCKCITVENDDGSFLATKSFIVTHNSSIQIRKAIHWATAPNLWPELWPRNARNPFFIPDFWYLYPTLGVATNEFEKKWIREFLPRGEFKDHPQYGWEDKYTNKMIDEIRFKTGATIKFQSYSQDTQNTQTATLAAIFTDEEMPEDSYHELSARLFGTDGYFHMVFTATMGQEFWRRAIEEDGRHRLFPTSFRQQVSAYDCLEYEDGSPTPWTLERIERNKARCRNQAEIDKRINGKFVLDEGLVYQSFSRGNNMCRPFQLPNGYWIYAGLDIGSGGEKGHPAAICFVATTPDLKKGFVFRGWRGDDVSTTASDILDKYLILKGAMPIMAAHYDFASKDFSEIATRRSVPILPANKNHDVGEGILNVLFKNQMLMIFEDDPELEKLVSELLTLRVDVHRLKAKNDFIDALRYCVSSIPWDWSTLNSVKESKKAEVQNPDRLRGDENPYEEYLQAEELNNLFVEANSLMEDF